MKFLQVAFYKEESKKAFEKIHSPIGITLKWIHFRLAELEAKNDGKYYAKVVQSDQDVTKVKTFAIVNSCFQCLEDESPQTIEEKIAQRAKVVMSEAKQLIGQIDSEANYFDEDNQKDCYAINWILIRENEVVFEASQEFITAWQKFTKEAAKLKAEAELGEIAEATIRCRYINKIDNKVYEITERL